MPVLLDLMILGVFSNLHDSVTPWVALGHGVRAVARRGEESAVGRLKYTFSIQIYELW